MRTQFYAVGLNGDQRPEYFGLLARQHGRKDDMTRYIGQYVGTNTRLFSEGDYEIVRLGRFSDVRFRTDQGVLVPGAIFSVAEL